jgi:hypothetical protein
LPKSLVIVESPAKAKTINKYLGRDYEVEASLGHIKDLPKSQLGVDLDGDDFTTEYIVIPGKEKVVAKLKKLAKTAVAIYLAPDPDREGEAIAAHLEEELTDGSGKKRGRRPSSIRARSTATWWTRSRRGACWTALWATRFHPCCGTRSGAGSPPGACRPWRCG